jgi:hypothetical protein
LGGLSRWCRDHLSNGTTEGIRMAWIGKAVGGSGIVAVAATSMTARLVIVGPALLLTLVALWIVREASRSSDDAAARRITWMLHGHDPDNRHGPSP